VTGAAAWAPSASAGTYLATICSPTADDQLFIVEGGSPVGTQGFHFKRECGIPFGGARLLADSETVRGALKLRVVSPPFTTIKMLEADRAFGPVPWNALFHWFVTDASNRVLEAVQSTAPLPGRVTYQVGSNVLQGELSCIRAAPGDCGVGDGLVVAEVDVSNVVATVEDNEAPTVAVTAPPVDTILSGTVAIPYEATDKGGGVEVSRLLLDAAQTAVTEDRDDNAGKCVEPFNFMWPCKTLVKRSFSLDTTQVPNGTHTLTPIVIDAAGNATPGQPFAITVHNGPTLKQRPTLSGAAKVNGKLTVSNGEWEGAPTAFAFQWLRCPANVADGSEAGCEPIGGASAADYLARAADVGMRLVAKVTASNASGADSALSAPSALVPTGPEGPPERSPQTTIKKHPRSKTALRTARFTFSSDQGDSSFQCKLDKTPFKPCASPFKRKVRRGRHVFQVRAQSPADVLDPTPARFRWRVL
jgi:hypothetical protein